MQFANENKFWSKFDLQLFPFKLMQNIIDPCNAGEHYQSFIRNENTKPVKQWKIITKERKLKKKGTLN